MFKSLAFLSIYVILKLSKEKQKNKGVTNMEQFLNGLQVLLEKHGAIISYSSYTDSLHVLIKSEDKKLVDGGLLCASDLEEN